MNETCAMNRYTVKWEKYKNFDTTNKLQLTMKNLYKKIQRT